MKIFKQMKNIKYLSVIIVMLLVSGCAENFLDQKNLYQKSDESYYKTPEDIDEALTGAYASLALDAGNNNPILVAELMSDDRFGGGGNNDDGFHSTDAFTLVDNDYYSGLFGSAWPGILRTNLILKRFDQAEYADETRRSQALGETYFLRAFFYFRLAQFFGPVPLKTEPVPENLPRATPEEMYGQIAQDLKNAIEFLPSVKFQSIPVTRLGHATKWAAEAMMARVFLFYTGYYNKSEIDLPDGGKVTKADVIAWLEDCINNSGHDLLPDFRNLWPYSKVDSYPLVAKNGLKWAEEKGANYETVFAIKYSLNGGWNAPNKLSYSNQQVLYNGLRGQSHVPFGQGWGAGPVNPQLWESFENGDIRKLGSILNVNEAIEEEGNMSVNYKWNGDNNH
jgi:starch-binding outer membrane protein, SusD/RagB family